jgi:Ca2+-binding EF-hand superfamily protein
MKNRILLPAVIAALLSLPLALNAAESKKGGFAAMDKNGDGKLDKKEFTAAQKDPAKAEKRFAQLDTDNDGFLTQKEMAAGQKKKKKN